jgi:hypothetical protein
MTDVLQPNDIGVNRSFKSKYREHYQKWLNEEIKNDIKLDFSLARLKNIHHLWIKKAYDHCNNKKISKRAFFVSLNRIFWNEEELKNLFVDCTLRKN